MSKCHVVHPLLCVAGSNDHKDKPDDTEDGLVAEGGRGVVGTVRVEYSDIP